MKTAPSIFLNLSRIGLLWLATISFGLRADHQACSLASLSITTTVGLYDDLTMSLMVINKKQADFALGDHGYRFDKKKDRWCVFPLKGEHSQESEICLREPREIKRGRGTGRLLPSCNPLWDSEADRIVGFVEVLEGVLVVHAIKRPVSAENWRELSTEKRDDPCHHLRSLRSYSVPALHVRNIVPRGLSVTYVPDDPHQVRKTVIFQPRENEKTLSSVIDWSSMQTAYVDCYGIWKIVPLSAEDRHEGECISD